MMVCLRAVPGCPGIYADIKDGLEPLFMLEIVAGERRYWHESGYGWLPARRVRIVG